MNEVMAAYLAVSNLWKSREHLSPGRRAALAVLRNKAYGTPIPPGLGANGTRVGEIGRDGPPVLLRLIAEGKLKVQSAQKAVSYLSAARILELAESACPQSAFASAVNAAVPGHYAEFRKPKGDRKGVEVVGRSVFAVS